MLVGHVPAFLFKFSLGEGVPSPLPAFGSLQTATVKDESLFVCSKPPLKPKLCNHGVRVSDHVLAPVSSFLIFAVNERALSINEAVLMIAERQSRLPVVV